jgi:predicted transcriptional regulator
MSKGEKPILSVRIDAELLKRLDALAEEADVGRAEVVERCLTLGLADQEQLVAWLKSPIAGPVVQLISHPAIIRTLLKMIGDDVDETSVKLRANVLKRKRRGQQGRPAAE